MFMAVVLDFVFLCFGSKQNRNNITYTLIKHICVRYVSVCNIYVIVVDCFCVLSIKKTSELDGVDEINIFDHRIQH